MKIGYFADGPWSHLALEQLHQDQRFEIGFIVPRFDTRDPVLREWATKLGVEFLLLEDVNAPESIETLRRQEVDVFVSMSYNQIFKTDAIALPPRGIINCHAGELPFYRGRNILNWALINDERHFGVTVHYITDSAIDTGDIILQKQLPITDQDTYATLLDRAIEACAAALVEALDQVRSGRVVAHPQQSVHPVGMYCGRRREGDEWIDWHWTSRRIFNFIRAISPPGPGACTVLDGTEVRVLRAEMIEFAPNYIGTPGEVVGLSSKGVVVKTGDSTVLITESRVASGQRLRMGARMGIEPMSVIQDLRRRITQLEQLISRREST